jgi:microcystin-dependent protein
MIVGTTVGNTGGVQAVTLATAQLPSFNHLAGSNVYGIHDDIGNALQAGTSVASVSAASTGGGGAHSNIPPTLIVNFIIKL